MTNDERDEITKLVTAIADANATIQTAIADANATIQLRQERIDKALKRLFTVVAKSTD